MKIGEQKLENRYSLSSAETLAERETSPARIFGNSADSKWTDHLAKGKRVRKMKKTTKILLLVFLGVAFACVLYIWVTLSPAAAVYQLIYDRSAEVNLALSFATALSTNHPAAYDMIDLALRPRLDEWMTAHQKMKCASRPEPFLVGSVTETAHSYGVYFSCFGGQWTAAFFGY